MSKWKNPKPKCPSCNLAMRYIHMKNTYHTIKLGYYCPRCNKIKLKPGIKLIQRDIFIGLNKY